MPWTPAQHRLWEFLAHDREAARRHGVSQRDAQHMAEEGIKKAEPAPITRKAAKAILAAIQKALKEG